MVALSLGLSEFRYALGLSEFRYALGMSENFTQKVMAGGATPLRPCRRIPYLPGGFGLEVEHLKAVFGDGSVLPSPTEKFRLGGIVDKVVEYVAGRQQMVGDVRGYVHVGIHAEGGAVDDEVGFGHESGGEVGVGDDAVSARATDELGMIAEPAQSIADSL